MLHNVIWLKSNTSSLGSITKLLLTWQIKMCGISEGKLNHSNAWVWPKRRDKWLKFNLLMSHVTVLHAHIQTKRIMRSLSDGMWRAEGYEDESVTPWLCVDISQRADRYITNDCRKLPGLLQRHGGLRQSGPCTGPLWSDWFIFGRNRI